MPDALTATSLLRDGFILLGSALAFVLLFRRLGLGATLGYLVAGAVMGPHVLGLVGDAEGKIGIAELGITLLLFVVGLELVPARLWRLRHSIFLFGTSQLLLSGCGAWRSRNWVPARKRSIAPRRCTAPATRNGCGSRSRAGTLPSRDRIVVEAQREGR